MRLILYLFISILFFSSCNDISNNTSGTNITVVTAKKANDITKFDSPSGISDIASQWNGLSGISTTPSVLVRDGIVRIRLVEGRLTTSSGEEVLIVKNNQIVGTLNLKNAATQIPISGTTIVTNDTILFTPDEPLHPEIVYSLVFIENETKTEIKEKVFISAANYCNPLSYFSKVPLQKIPTSSNQFARLEIQKNIYTDAVLGDVAIIGWDHISSNNFYFKINDRTLDAKYKVITAYGSYNIPGHECELYYQRDINSPFPTWVDNNYGSKSTKVTWEDTAIHNPISKEYYRFAKSYIVLKVFNSSNVDVTSSDKGILSLQQTDRVYGLPNFKTDEESSLLAYLNRGNNNSYSMVLIGLTVGIFAFFLSRRLFDQKEDN